MKLLAIIPARKGSKEVLNKNYKKFNGKPLIYWTIKAALKSNCFDKIVVSTDSKKIQTFSKKMGVECPLLRPKKLSGDKINVHRVIKHVINYYKKKNKYTPAAVTLLQPTSPLREFSDIKNCCKIFKKFEPDSLVSVLKIPHNYNPENLYILKKNYLIKIRKGKKLFPRQQQKIYYARNGASIYMTKTDKIKNYILGGKIKGYEMNKLKSIDINDKKDFILAEIIQKKFKYNLHR